MRRNPDWYTGKRATTGRERDAPVRKARILGSMGVVVRWWIFAGAEWCGARGLADGEAGGEEEGGEGKGEGFGGRGLGRFFDENCERIVTGQKRRY